MKTIIALILSPFCRRETGKLDFRHKESCWEACKRIRDAMEL